MKNKSAKVALVIVCLLIIFAVWWCSKGVTPPTPVVEQVKEPVAKPSVVIVEPKPVPVAIPEVPPKKDRN